MADRRRVDLTPVVMLVALLAAGPGSAQPATWEIDPARSRVIVHVDAAGVLAPLLTDHHFTPQAWTGSIGFDPGRPEQVRVEIAILADSLVDLQEHLSPEDRQTVARQVRSPAILDVERHPEIRFRADRFQVHTRSPDGGAGTIRGVLHGDLTVRGETRPVALPVEARWSAHALHVTATTEFLQSDFGIEPYRRFLGAVAVADRLRVDIEITAEPALP